jgi:hypothetical protein
MGKRASGEQSRFGIQRAISSRVMNSGVNPVQPHRIAATHRRIHVGRRVDKVQHATGAVHHVEVEIPRKPFPQFQRKLVEMRIGIEVVIRADDGRVAPGIAAAQPSLLQHRDIGQPVLLGEVVGGREPMPAATDDYRVIARLRRRASPCKRPILVIRERIAGKGEDRVLHGSSPVRTTVSTNGARVSRCYAASLTTAMLASRIGLFCPKLPEASFAAILRVSRRFYDARIRLILLLLSCTANNHEPSHQSS